MALPELVPSVPQAGTAPAVVLAVVGGVLYALLALRALWTFALTRRFTDLVVALGCAWLGAALIPQLILGFGTVGFYGGHVLELAGIAMIAIPAVADLARGGASRPLVGNLSAKELVAAEEAYLGPRVRALLVSLAAKDDSTEQHTRRVALRAVQVGEALRLPADVLRELALGALLHDIGKLSVPDAVLKKPSGLTDEEFDQIKKHPGAGLRLLQALGGFSAEVHALVHEHHERLDGSGYPQGLRGDELALPTRILAVCDVYDALTSDRVYRGAWRTDAAMRLLREGAGTQFDPRCVDALAQVLAAEDAHGVRWQPPVVTGDAAPAPAPAG
jgi:putative nucleotidyltransferase with HDIG domain